MNITVIATTISFTPAVAAGRLADHFAGAFEQAAGVDDEEAEREDDVDRAHPRSVPILGELRHRRPPDAAEHRRHDPVEAA